MDHLERECGLRSAEVGDALRAVPRETFVPDAAASDGLEAVYRNEVIVTRRDGTGRATSSSSQPSMVAAMLERLDLRPCQRVLEVGAGTGWNAALLSRLVGTEGRVVSVDIDTDIADRARRALASGGYKVNVVAADGWHGFEPAAPYDRIVVTASAEEVSRAWLDQLVPGGLLLVPLRLTEGGRLAVVLFRREGGRFAPVGTLAGGFLPLRTGAGAPPPRALPALSAHEWMGRGRPLFALTGQGVAGLPQAERRRLLALALGEPRLRPLPWRGPASALQLFVGLGAARRAVDCSIDGSRARPGLVTRTGEGAGLAVLGTGRRISSLAGWGDPSAEVALADLVQEWQALGRPGRDRLRIGARFGRAHPAWRTVRRGGCVLEIDWERP